MLWRGCNQLDAQLKQPHAINGPKSFRNLTVPSGVQDAMRLLHSIHAQVLRTMGSRSLCAEACGALQHWLLLGGPECRPDHRDTRWRVLEALANLFVNERFPTPTRWKAAVAFAALTTSWPDMVRDPRYTGQKVRLAKSSLFPKLFEILGYAEDGIATAEAERKAHELADGILSGAIPGPQFPIDLLPPHEPSTLKPGSIVVPDIEGKPRRRKRRTTDETDRLCLVALDYKSKDPNRPDGECAAAAGISRSTFSRYLQRQREQLDAGRKAAGDVDMPKRGKRGPGDAREKW